MNCFDMIGPVMVGPSSSHTAGAVRLGQVARALLTETPVRAVIGLYGSFARTAYGHGTDKALLAGLLGFAPDDERIRESKQLASKAGLSCTFTTLQLDRAHPNTTVIEIWGESGRKISMRGASMGGGRIRVEAINGLEVSFCGEYMTLVIRHQDTPGVIAEVTQRLARCKINIANMRVFRSCRGGSAIMIIETDQIIPANLRCAISQAEGVHEAVLLQPIGDKT